jgi:ABC-type multidrug transport system fused ATPase/permease subunit
MLLSSLVFRDLEPKLIFYSMVQQHTAYSSVGLSSHVAVCYPLMNMEPRLAKGHSPNAAQLPRLGGLDASRALHPSRALGPLRRLVFVCLSTNQTNLRAPVTGSRRRAAPAPMAPTVEINHLTFTYPGIDGRPPPGAPPLIEDVCFSLDAGQRCLLLGSNGAGHPPLHLLRFSRLSLGVDLARRRLRFPMR